MTIREQEDQLISEFNSLGDWFSQYEYLLTYAAELPCIDVSQRPEANRIRGCQSGVWLWTELQPDGLMRIRIESDSLILKGILALYVHLFDRRSCSEIVGFQSRLIQETSLKEQLSTDRFRGIRSVLSQIQSFAENGDHDLEMP